MIVILAFFTLLINSIQEPVHEEKNGRVEIEAEAFLVQRNCLHRSWYVVKDSTRLFEDDPDSMEYRTASGNVFIELLPDTRVTHDDELIPGINFSNTPGLSVLEYKIHFQTPGKYYVWVRAFSTGSEDNGIHVGIDGEWPESGQRMQWCEDKNQWTWASRQRTDANHCGEPEKIFIEVKDKGTHTILFSMREDGFAFDKFVLSTVYEISFE